MTKISHHRQHKILCHTHMELSLVAIPSRVDLSPCQPGYGLLHGRSRDLGVATHQGLQDGIVDEGVLILEEACRMEGRYGHD